MADLAVTGMQKPASKAVPLLLKKGFPARPGIHKVMVQGPPNTGLKWSDAVQQAASIGGRLPTVAEVKFEKRTTGDFDQWQPVSDKGTDFWIQTGNAGRLYA